MKTDVTIRPARQDDIAAMAELLSMLFAVEEDFAFLCENTPGALAFVGIGNKEKLTDYPLHSDKFNIDEDVLPIGAALHAQFALDFLQETS